jgi:molecular chaperone DnaK (HSP70)
MEILVGIDFGTTNTVISYFENNTTKILMDGNYKLIPSKIARYNDKYYCGNYIPLLATDIIMNFKHLNNMEYFIIFFSHLKELIINKLGNKIIKAVITVPSNFSDKQRETIKSVFINIGINVIRLINEPTSASFAYGLNSSLNNNERILVLDIGGGTTDITILEKTDDLFSVIHSYGLNDLGGNDFTNVIYTDMLSTNNVNIENKSVWHKADMCKKKLSVLDSYSVKINDNTFTINRKKFANLCNSLLDRFETMIKEVCFEYSFQYIIMVGGSSRLLLLQELVHNITKIKPWVHPNLDTLVAEGAGLFAGILENKYAQNEDIVLLDVVPLSLGIELADGTFSIIIPKNTPIPIKNTQKYTTDSDNIKINVYQGERKIANQNILIGSMTFDKILLKGVPVIDITFKIDNNGIIHLSALDKKSGIEKIVIFKDLPKLNADEIENIINNACRLADADINEANRKHSIYLINTHIENALINLQINTLMDETEKNIIRQRFIEIEETMNELTNTRLIEIIGELEITYKILINGNLNMNNEEPPILYETLTCEKDELKYRVNILINKNPELENELLPILETLSYNNVSNDYISAKIDYLDKLEKTIFHDYKSELHNLCMYLKNEIAIGNIELNAEALELLNVAINKNIDLINCNDIDWKCQLDKLNDLCELL